MVREPAATGDLAGRLDRLFVARRLATGREPSFQEVADEIQARGGPTISGTYLWQLHRGLRDNPTKRHLEALADYFGVPPGYFFDDPAEGSVLEPELLALYQSSPIRDLALGALGLSAASLAVLTAMVGRLREIEGLAAAAGAQPRRRRRRRFRPAARPPA